MSPSRRLSDLVTEGKDYEAKVKIDEILDHEVMVVGFTEAVSTTLPPVLNPETGELEPQKYFNVNVDDGGVLKTFSTGAVPIKKVLAALSRKANEGEEIFPFMATFAQEGQTFTIK